MSDVQRVVTVAVFAIAWKCADRIWYFWMRRIVAEWRKTNAGN